MPALSFIWIPARFNRHILGCGSTIAWEPGLILTLWNGRILQPANSQEGFIRAFKHQEWLAFQHGCPVSYPCLWRWAACLYGIKVSLQCAGGDGRFCRLGFLRLVFGRRPIFPNGYLWEGWVRKNTEFMPYSFPMS